MKAAEKKRAIKELKEWIIKYTHGCVVNNGGWSCGTCTCALLQDLGIKENGEHNKPVDRVNEVWRAILQLRGDKE